MMRQKQAAGVAMQARIAQAWCTTLFVRMKYYFAWKVRLSPILVTISGRFGWVVLFQYPSQMCNSYTTPLHQDDTIIF